MKPKKPVPVFIQSYLDQAMLLQNCVKEAAAFERAFPGAVETALGTYAERDDFDEDWEDSLEDFLRFWNDAGIYIDVDTGKLMMEVGYSGDPFVWYPIAKKWLDLNDVQDEDE